ncbi:hypothetical protein AK830_g7037 [Neonectria ditissima]|uniref:Uncharacterized protein n=1 Tax=Neonectria ditissima TaxID=78410 RepID=A0A0P7AY25_9HYPO|nr:hypothetical protein AK830_g7037 [Neonectria ditissima]
MWLIDVVDFSLKSFHDPPPRYAILSHTWGEDEVVFRDMDDIHRAQQKSAWKKIQLTCSEARANMLPYAWIDSCCIDKSSSAELSEAINSMLKWYQQATCCYAYLEDFEIFLSQNAATISRTAFNQLAQCRWFTRGWTLQELIAAPEVVFFSRTWQTIGTKETLKHDIAEITGIDKEVLESMAYMSGLPVGRRMSWAAKRHTTRVEDMAYCLMGIFNVNMPLLYGEGEKAFVRLQEEIAKQHRDLSLFAWRQLEPIPQYRGIFAHSPAEFINCSSLVSRNTSFFSEPNYSITDTGLMVDVRWGDDSTRGTFALGLDCMAMRELAASNQTKSETIAISLQKFGEAYVRAMPHTVAFPKDKIVHPGRGTQTEEVTGTICLKKSLPRSHSDFIGLMLQRKLVLLYRRELAEELDILNGRRRTPEQSLDHPDYLQSICLRNGVEPSSFSIVHQYNISAGGDPIWWDSFSLPQRDDSNTLMHFAVVCGIPLKPNAPSEHILPWFALFSNSSLSAENREIASMLVRNHRETSSAEVQRYVGDSIFENYADQGGNILQATLPISVIFEGSGREIYEVRVNRLGAGGSTFCADVQYQRFLAVS